MRLRCVGISLTNKNNVEDLKIVERFRVYPDVQGAYRKQKGPLVRGRVK